MILDIIISVDFEVFLFFFVGDLGQMYIVDLVIIVIGV